MNGRLRALHARKDKTLAEANVLIEGLADDETLDEEQEATFDAHMATVEKLNKQIKREEALDAEVLSLPSPEKPAASTSVTGGEPQILEDPKRGFAHFGEYATAVKRAADPGFKRVDERLSVIMAAAPGDNIAREQSGEEGGFLVPPDFAGRIEQYSLDDQALLPFTQTDPVQGNSIHIPVDETTPWGTNGIRAYWEGEAALATKTRPALESRELRLRKLFGLVPVSDEMLEDTTFMSSYLQRKLGESIRYKTNDAIVNGATVGVPEGFVESGALVTQAKEASQAADTIVAANVAKMYGRCLDPTRAIWMTNPDSYNQLITMTIGDQPIWTPPNSGIARAPNGLLLGRPLIMSEQCQTLGDAGDIYFAALNHYQTITKGRGIDFATSLHLWFDYDLAAFRAIFRLDGQSLYRQPVTPPNSAVTRSPFVRLAART